MTISYEKLNYWADIYQQLDREYDVYFMHPDMSFKLFLVNPEENERWLKIYMANPRLFVNRHNGAVVFLSFFLQNNPADIFNSLLVADSNTVKNLDFLPPLQKQVLCALKFAQTDIEYIRECYHHFYWKRKTKQLEMHGDRLIEPFHHHVPCKKYKTGGMAHA